MKVALLRMQEMLRPSAVFETVGYYFSGTVLKAGWTAGAIFSGFSWLTGYRSVWVFMALMALMTLELVTCYFSKSPAERINHPWERYITGKFLILSLVIVGLIMDLMIRALGTLAHDWGLAELQVQDYRILPITLSSLVWMVGAEGFRVSKNVAKSEGSAAIPPTIRWFIHRLRSMDETKFPDQPVPKRRAYDTVVEGDNEEFIHDLAEGAPDEVVEGAREIAEPKKPRRRITRERRRKADDQV